MLAALARFLLIFYYTCGLLSIKILTSYYAYAVELTNLD